MRVFQSWWQQVVAQYRIVRCNQIRFRPLRVATLIAAGALGLIICIQLAPVGFRSWRIFYNVSRSVPAGWYRVHKRSEIQRGDTLLLCLPQDTGRYAVRRGYVRQGTCPGGAGRIGKPVLAITGDTVIVEQRGVSINDSLWVWAPAQLRDRLGRPMDAALGRHVLQLNECFLLSTHSTRSYDSRYFGPVPCTQPFFVLQ